MRSYANSDRALGLSNLTGLLGALLALMPDLTQAQAKRRGKNSAEVPAGFLGQADRVVN